MNLTILQSIIRDLRDDCAAMRRVNPDGRVDGFAARFEGYAAALEGHVPPNPLPPTATTPAQVLQTIEKDKIENDEDDAPIQP